MHKEKLFAKIQEAVWKDIERTFWVLQGRGHFFGHVSRFMTVDTMDRIVRCLMIIHNMCVEERIDASGGIFEDVDCDDDVVMSEDRPPMSAGAGALE